MLQLGELVGVVVHPVPNGFLQGGHEGELGHVLQVLELGHRLCQQLDQTSDVDVYVLDQLDVWSLTQFCSVDFSK